MKFLRILYHYKRWGSHVFPSTSLFESPQSSVHGSRKIICSVRSFLYRKWIKIQTELRDAKSRSERYKKIYYRLLKAKQTSPKKAVKKSYQYWKCSNRNVNECSPKKSVEKSITKVLEISVKKNLK